MPINDFVNYGVNITINTDNPIICNTTLKNELYLIADAFNLNYDDIIKLQLNAIRASFASQKVKEEIIKLIRNQ